MRGTRGTDSPAYRAIRMQEQRCICARVTAENPKGDAHSRKQPME